MEENNRTEMARGDCCRLLAAFFYPPDQKLFVEEGLAEKFRALFEIVCPAATVLALPLAGYLQGGGQVELAVAYTRLFLGPPAMLAPPFASFYLDRGGGVMGPSTVEIMKLYRAAGLVLDSDFDQTPDHVSVMLEFLYYLAYREDIAAARDDLEEKAMLEEKKLYFLNTYVTTWIPRFCAKITSADEHPFYTGLGKCLDAFVRYWCDPPTQTEHGI